MPPVHTGGALTLLLLLKTTATEQFVGHNCLFGRKSAFSQGSDAIQQQGVPEDQVPVMLILLPQQSVLTE